MAAGLYRYATEAEDIKGKIRRFLGYRLKLELSERKTLITHGRTEPARFLGYEIVVHDNDAKHDRNGHRCINAAIGLKMPMDVVRAKRKPYMRRGKPVAILARAHDSDFRIVARYQEESGASRSTTSSPTTGTVSAC